MDPKTPVSQLSGIGKWYSQKLKRLEVKTLEDLIYHFPFRWDDFSTIANINNITPGEKLSIQGIVWKIQNIRTRMGKFVTLATIADQSGTIEVTWFNQPFLTKIIKAGMQISLAGKVEVEGSKPKLVSPSYEIIKSPDVPSYTTPGVSYVDTSGKGVSQTLHTGRLVPIYPETEGATSKWIRAKIAKYLPIYTKNLKDHLPKKIMEEEQLEKLESALKKIHFPKNYGEVSQAKLRLAFDELFLTQLMAILAKEKWKQNRKALPMTIDKSKILTLTKVLPFNLTDAQKRACREIAKDMQREIPMNRLLEGDVGSGKTVVAAIASYIAFLNGTDTLVAAPTEILTFQHQKTFEEILSPFKVTVGIWTGSRKIKGDITCGTHALLTTFKPQKQVGLIIVDEQHRFGTAQRAKLFMDQSGKLTPHLLTMTATPIPRTLALTLYGDLDLSVLDQMPTGRQKIATFVVPNNKRNDAYGFIEKEISAGRQAFIITPFVEPSETMATVKAATEEFTKLKKNFSKKVKLGLLHGRLKSKEKEKIINNFKNVKVDILVATPVVEVGIDVPNATIMMIESADRFGLAQLHQLRGRVGRGKYKSYCLLFTDSLQESSIGRLKSMERLQIGFELAEADLEMRGPGEIFGLKQSGFVDFKIASLSDHQLIEKTQKAAQKVANSDPTLKKYPLLAEKISQLSADYSQPN